MNNSLLKHKSLAKSKKMNSVFPMAFTLIELLVVIAVIAMLAALLMPALAKARYRAKNVICMSNQKQIAAGVTMYTSDYDSRYPVRTDPVYRESADVVQRAASTTDYVNQLRPYFGGNLKATWVCPLAPPKFLIGGATWSYRQSRDLDTTTGDAMTSYAHYYGRMKQTGDASTFQSSWGTGGFEPQIPMLKSGQPFHDWEYWSNSVKEYNVLLSDSMWLWNSGTLAYTHQPFNKVPLIEELDRYCRLRTNPDYMLHDLNYALDDGSVHALPSIRKYDKRITLNRSPSTWGWAWILPRPE